MLGAGLGLRLDGFPKAALDICGSPGPEQPTEEITANRTSTHIVEAFSGLKKRTTKSKPKTIPPPVVVIIITTTIIKNCQMCGKLKVLRASQAFILGKDLEGDGHLPG